MSLFIDNNRYIVYNNKRKDDVRWCAEWDERVLLCYRSDPSRKNPHQGSGLGLAIVAKTLERMGGSICAENLPEGGLRITMKIPLA